jgi:enoyl-CoA hydratase
MNPSPDTDEIIIRREGRAGRITLNRPKALNALTYPQIGQIRAALEAWREEAGVALVILDGAGDRALCAGGDVLTLYEKRDDGGRYARQFWWDEYHLNQMIARYPKPYVALMDGIVMGGGIGLSAHASHRIVTERSMLAMPETGIGLVPDVGGTWLLSQAPGHFGEYLGLLGERMNAGDAILMEFADTTVQSDALDDLVAALVAPDGDPVGVTIANLASAPPPPVLVARQDSVDEIFALPTLEAILDALAKGTQAWHEKALATARQRSPLALKLTLAAVRRVREMASVEDALNLEYRLVTRLFRHGEFIEGIRALLVDKDKDPQWTPPTVAGVTADMVDAFLAPLPPGEALDLRKSQGE